MTGYESVCDSDDAVSNLDLNNSIVEPGEVVEVVEGDDIHMIVVCLCPDEIVPDKSTSTTLRNPSLAHKHDSAGSVIENEPAESCLYVSGVLRKVVLVDLSASVSDQEATNVSAVNQLVKGSSTGRHDARHLKKYNVSNRSVIHVYDPSHLLKGIRNNLMKRDLYWERERDIVSARWDDIIYAYEADNTSGELRSMPKMTDGQVYAAKMNKMKVSCAAQVFSHLKVSMDPQNLKDIATILKFFDGLFDSVNASTLFNKSGKEYKCAATARSLNANCQEEGSANILSSVKTFVTQGVAEEAESTLPIRFGGLGIRRISDICLPAFLSSINGVKKLVSLLLNSKDNELNIHHYDEALAVWGVANENEIPTIPQFQKNWDNINIKGIIANDLIFNSPRDLARFKALQCRESGSWLHAIPSPNIGTLLDNTSFQVCIGLRLGCNLCTPHICKCNAKVDEIGTHGLSCFKSSGRFSRHTEINSIINRSLTSIHVNSTLEPNGLSRDDGKRPDGMTLVPWIKGQPLVWDVTVVDTLADSYVLKSSEVSGSAAEMACKRKHSKYSSIISSNYVFKGLAFETLGPWCKEAIDFINVIGNRLIAESGDSKSKKFLFERISLAIQRGNAASIRGTFPDSAILSEIFVL
ncbi:hypothetical protein GEV33_004647 [Tenebrio molitor]|uniref:Transposable element P transposase-like GTP-binding insertion domain-containing protein n=1 Tax=Tenebrio molitor TaxID=7067 RepID=A0A8J6HP13_TENMO|nr:hypothetical protein GEV33_004647 [Tenebrio molitor]